MSLRFSRPLASTEPRGAEHFPQASVFRGGFTREAALAVVETRMDVLISLTNKALISHHADASRFEMHELLRQFAEEQLKLSGERETILSQHAAYFANFLNARLPMLQSRTPQAGSTKSRPISTTFGRQSFICSTWISPSGSKLWRRAYAYFSRRTYISVLPSIIPVSPI